MYKKIKNKIEYLIDKVKLNAKLKNEYDGEDYIYYIPTNNQKIESKNILIAAHDLSKHIFGGERSFLDMVEALYYGGHNVLVVLPRLINSEYIDKLAKYCVKIYIVPYKVWGKNRINSNSVRKLKKIISKNEINLVYVNTIVCRDPLEAAHALGIPRVVHVRECIDKDEDLRRIIGIESAETIINEVQKSADFLICNSFITSQIFNAERHHIVFNKININEFQSAYTKNTNEEVVFGLISSNIPKKGIFDLVELAKKSSHIIKAKFVLIGPRNVYTEKIQFDIKEYNLKNLKILGYYTSSLDALKECDVVLSLSHFAESFGRTVGEAMAAKKPVIAYRWGAIPELVESDVTGFLCDYRDIQQMVKSIDSLCREPELIEKMGEKGLEKIKKISSPDVYNKKLNKVIDLCLLQNNN